MRNVVFQGPLRGVALAALMAGALAGCSAGPLDTRAAYETPEAATSENNMMASLPPAAGAPVAVIQSQAHGVLTQRIVLRGDPNMVGENAIVVKVNVDHGPTDIDGPVGLPTRAKIAAELDENFAGVDMAFSSAFARNSFGPFGYAVGHPRNGETCLYAWQFAVHRPGLIGSAPTGAPSLPTQPTSVRVRLCRSSLGEGEMVQMLRDLQVYPPNSRVAYMDPSYTGIAADGDALGAAGVGYFVVPGVIAPARATHDRPHKHLRKLAHRRRHHSHDIVREERAVAEDAPIRRTVEVPMPAGGGAPMAIGSSNPLLAPLAAARPVPKDDLPLPGIEAAAKPAPARASIPLPN